MGEVNKKSLKGGDGDGVIGVCGTSGSRVGLATRRVGGFKQRGFIQRGFIQRGFIQRGFIQGGIVVVVRVSLIHMWGCGGGGG